MQPNHPGAHHLLGIALERQGDARGAPAAFLRVLDLVPGRTDVAVRASGLLLAIGDREEAANRLFITASAAASSDPVAAHLCRARALGLTERHNEAADELNAVLSLQSRHAEAWRLLGHTLSSAGAMEPWLGELVSLQP